MGLETDLGEEHRLIHSCKITSFTTETFYYKYFIDNVCMAHFSMESLNHENINQVCLIFTVYICKMTLRNCNAYIEAKVHILKFLFFCFVHIHITLYINNCIVKMTQVFTCVIYFI